jgi:hypothetical protein
MTARPWRAAAFYPMHPGRYYAASASAKTRAGLDRFVTKWSDPFVGTTVEVWEVLPLTDVTDGTQIADRPRG